MQHTAAKLLKNLNPTKKKGGKKKGKERKEKEKLRNMTVLAHLVSLGPVALLCASVCLLS